MAHRMYSRIQQSAANGSHPETARDASGRTGRSSGTIVVVDHEPIRRTAVVDALRDHGFKAIAVVDGSAAVRFCAQERGNVSLVITTDVASSMSGATLVRVLQVVDPAIRIISSSDVSELLSYRTVLDADVDDLLFQPYGEETLCEAVAAALRRPARHRSTILN